MKSIENMSDSDLLRVINHLRKVKDDLIVNYNKLLELTDNVARRKEIQTEIFFLNNSDVENVSKSGKIFMDEARKRELI